MKTKNQKQKIGGLKNYIHIKKDFLILLKRIKKYINKRNNCLRIRLLKRIY